MTDHASRDRHRISFELFERCLPLGLEERSRVLDAADVDVDTRAEVEELLALDAGAPESSVDERIGLRVELGGPAELPSSIGGYRIVRRLGEGAMGEVFLAEQSSPRRQVALKVLRVAAQRGSLLRRFEFEADVLARLDHPAIARIIEAGTEPNGRPFFAMEYVEGAPLDEFVRVRALDRVAILRLVETIARAVHHAHLNGIVHRDLKPANILVTADGQPKVLDFGVARLAARDEGTTQHTLDGQVVGTLGYMSPEQASGDVDMIDAGSDVYALGVMLFEALAGRPPIDTAGRPLGAALLAIQEDSPTRLGAVDASFAGDVETIAQRALEKERARRYPSAEAFAEDIRRHLEHEPILARPQTRTYQLSRFVRRHRALVAGLGAAFVALAVGLVVALVALSRAEAENRRATRESLTHEAIDRFILRDMIGAANPLNSGREVRVVDVLEAARPRIESAFEGQPEVRAGVRLTLGVSYTELGLSGEAVELLEAALADARTQFDDDHPTVLEARFELARALSLALDPRALPIYEDLYARAVAEDGESSERALELAGGLATAASMSGDLDGAVALAEENLARAEAVFGSDSAAASGARAHLLGCLDASGDWNRAVAVGRDSVARLEADHGPDDPRTLRARLRVADLLSFLGQYDEAFGLVRAIVSDSERIFGPESGMTIGARLSEARIHSDRQDNEAALGELDALVPLAESAIGADHPTTLLIRNDRVVCLRRLGRHDDALAEAEGVLARHLSDPRWRETAIAESHDRIAAIHLDARNYEAAAGAMQKALEAGEIAFGPEHPRMADILFNFGELLVNQGRLVEAEANYRRLIELDSKLRGPEHPYVCSERHNLARTVALQGRNEEALELLEELLVLEERIGLRDERQGIATNFEAVRVLAELGRFGEAIPRGLAQLAAMEAAGQHELVDQLWVHGKLAYVYGKAGDTAAEAKHQALIGGSEEGGQ